MTAIVITWILYQMSAPVWTYVLIWGGAGLSIILSIIGAAIKASKW